MKAGSAEKQLTRGGSIRYPKWSYDGRWIAYWKGESTPELWAWDTQAGQAYLLSMEADPNFRWAPNRNSLAFVRSQRLSVVQPEQPAAVHLVASHISNYAWQPDGRGFLASEAAQPTADGWTPVRLVYIPPEANAEPQLLYVLPKPSDSFFAVGTSTFKWSATGRWIAFLATPTASLSSDGNTLCLLSSDGLVFKPIDQMVNNEQYFGWAPEGDSLAYIEGVGREGTTNKHLKVLDNPQAAAKTYTPSGYVELGFTWHRMRNIVASRAQEAEWTSDITARPLPSLVHVKLSTWLPARRIAPPPTGYGQFNPISLPFQQLAWVQSDRRTASVVVANAQGLAPAVWIERLDLGESYYEQWNWSSVLQFYK